MDAPAHQVEAELITRASTGDRTALSALVDHCVLLEHAGVTPFETFAVAEGIARLAAARGGSHENMMLSAILRVRAYHVAELGDLDRAQRLLLQSEVICDDWPSIVVLSEGVEYLAGVLTAQADAGDELAADRLNKLTAALSPSGADKLRRALNEACRQVRNEQESLAKLGAAGCA